MTTRTLLVGAAIATALVLFCELWPRYQYHQIDGIAFAREDHWTGQLQFGRIVFEGPAFRWQPTGLSGGLDDARPNIPPAGTLTP